MGAGGLVGSCVLWKATFSELFGDGSASDASGRAIHKSFKSTSALKMTDPPHASARANVTSETRSKQFDYWNPSSVKAA